MSDDVFIVFGDNAHRVNDDRTFDEVLEQIRSTFPSKPTEIPVHLQPRGFENLLLEGTLLIGSNTTVAKIVPGRMPWP